VTSIEPAKGPISARKSGRIMNHDMAKEGILKKLVGVWELRSWTEIRPDGTADFPLGIAAHGQNLYTPDGHVAAQLIKADRATFASEHWRDASDAEGARAFKEYFGYFGTFSIDPEKQALIHHIEGAWFPNLLGTDQVRIFQFVDNQLVLDADTEWGKVRIEWKRTKNAASSI
jgi:Lipocalin-like domain